MSARKYTPDDVGRADAIYARLVAREGLFGQAFYGWDSSRAVQHRLATLWRTAQREARKS
jgi:hypothetical protein